MMVVRSQCSSLIAKRAFCNKEACQVLDKTVEKTSSIWFKAVLACTVLGGIFGFIKGTEIGMNMCYDHNIGETECEKKLTVIKYGLIGGSLGSSYGAIIGVGSPVMFSLALLASIRICYENSKKQKINSDE